MGISIGINLSLVGGGRVRPGSGVILQSQSVDVAGAVVNPNPTGTGDITLASPILSGVALWNPIGTGAIDLVAQAMAAIGVVANPNPTGTGDVSLAAQTVDASGAVSSTIFTADFTTQSAGAGSVSSYGLSFSRASSGHSVQTGTNTVSTSGTIGNNDVPRFGKRLDANNIGLVIEESRVQLCRDARNMTGAPAWSTGAGSFTANAGTGPDGQTLADRLNSGSGAVTRFTGDTQSAGTYTSSEWHKAFTEPTTWHHVVRPNAAANTSALGGSATSSWERVAITVSHSSSTIFQVPADGRDFSANGGLTAGARDNLIDFVQLELGSFATEAIVSVAATATRAGERLYHATGSSLQAADDSLRFYVKLRPKGSSSGYASDMRLWHVGANDHAEVVAATGAVNITIGGSAYTTATAASWAANDLVEFWVAAGGGSNATVVKYRVNGGSVTTLSTGSPPTQAAITISGAIDLLCNGTANQFTSWCENIETYPTGGSPAGF